ncbi:16S rRNA (guanine(966)-N(2))-methyltransferase RsmD [candidate division WWE3 bacterium RIFOXYC1_FULL_40_10]|nr:MAG: 16S rRNA (guanine(966)-N(2))-methyltransferase RsmD [candidate division WWE3 bacterium RIFOXYB1_FULL_40_22]OGC61514.1 MAG: 16S rRNA (guanine(966)-N(2))-methyltransferase RsmD [candidate division WWE3 bacterium RIFOXYA1_FULL_40_11]OGC65897.1 MAG: 16S rRNA (guanine(966)-N(2))-methyltransferase RsmD [candidate division WWE3 bacterium RIFOXYC1_FULL_40_10]OGC67414.1 MAG: 16S rRNA (guanine(966)-N(2))-methyltransferase RsmD [candidate division WWE3 bacterium RIFOXYC2_FULL_40_11]OGC71147.1 MAG:
MIRVTTGTAKNKKLIAPNIEGFRAVQDVAKLALFSILGDKIIGAECLDLFAGSGSVGIEALSRGAAYCDFVDENPKAVEAIEVNLRNCGFEENCEIHRKNAAKFTGDTDKKYDVIFADPFYDDTKHVFLFSNIEMVLEDNGVVVFFHAPETDIQANLAKTTLKIIDQRKFGKSVFSVLRKG